MVLCYVISVDILLKATGNAPIMKKKKWAVDAEKPIGWIMEFVKKYLKLEPEEKLVNLYYVLTKFCLWIQTHVLNLQLTLEGLKRILRFWSHINFYFASCYYPIYFAEVA